MTVAALVFGILSPLENALRWLLERFHYDVGLTWAWAIVGTTLVVRVALVPLAVRQIHSMQALQKHAPEMKEIQKKYKGDRQKMNEEMMRFYKENHINPAASCFPLLAQAPVFIALYFVLKNFSKHVPPGSDLSWLHFVPNITAKANSHWSGYVLLAVYAGEPDLLDLLHVAGDGQDAAADHDDPPARLHHRHRPLPGGPRHLLGHDEPVDGRAGPDHTAARAAPGGRGCAGCPEALVADAGAGRRRRQRRRNGTRAGAAAPAPAAAQQHRSRARRLPSRAA